MAVCKYCLSNHTIAFIQDLEHEYIFRPINLVIYKARLYVRDGEHDIVATSIAEVKLQSEKRAFDIMQCFGLIWFEAEDFSDALLKVKQDYEAKLHLFVSDYYEKEGLL